MINGKYHSISEEKLIEILRLVKHCDSYSVYLYTINYDWFEGEKHQQWLDETSPEEIANWCDILFQ